MHGIVKWCLTALQQSYSNGTGNADFFRPFQRVNPKRAVTRSSSHLHAAQNPRLSVRIGVFRPRPKRRGSRASSMYVPRRAGDRCAISRTLSRNFGRRRWRPRRAATYCRLKWVVESSPLLGENWFDTV